MLFSDTVQGTLHDGVLLIEIRNPPVNATSADVRQGLLAAVTHGQVAPAIAAMVLRGQGATFIGGADIREFGQPVADPSLPAVIQAIETSRKPVVAAITGPALGGGCEVALATHLRLGSAEARIGLPEVKLGIVPGAGGTQRLPRLTGLVAAIELIGSGKIVGAEEAKQLGILDGVVGDVTTEAIAAARALIGKQLRRTGELPVPNADAAALDRAAAAILAKARGRKAPVEAVRLVKSVNDDSFAERLADERATFLRLRDSEEAAALRHIFFAERAAAKVPGLSDVSARAVKTIGIVGTGLMGSGVAVAALEAGYAVIGVDQSEDTAAKGRARIDGLLTRNVEAGRLTEAGRAERMARLTTSGSLAGLADADLVIEAVFDDLAIKSVLFARLDTIVRADAILATNTSYLDLDIIAKSTSRPDRLLGLHFFSPANIMRLVEVVRCAATTPDVLATGIAVAKRLGKLPVVCGVCEGFVGNRIFSAYRRQAEFLVEDGALPHEIDGAMEEYGFAMGPFAVFDLAGLEIAWARRKRQAATRDTRTRYVDLPDKLCESGRFGQKTGQGWYRYVERQRKVDPEVTAMIEDARREKGISPRAISAQEIVTTLLAVIANEGAKVLGEKLVTRASDIDLVLVNGYGFPAHKGGPMFAADRLGLPDVLATMQRLHQRDGIGSEPAPLLAELAAQGKRFSDFGERS
jgi:3-hydroxyacyl-CoA dehydrogenase